MAETSTYKPKGNVLSPYEDSAKLKLKSITQPVLEEFKTSGKVDADALNKLAKTQNANLTEIVKYMLELINQQSDTTTDKLKTELKSLADSLVTDLKTNAANNNIESDDTISEKQNVANENVDVNKLSEQITEKLKSQLENNLNEATLASSSDEDNLAEKISDKLKGQFEKNVSKKDEASKKDKNATISELKKEFANQTKANGTQTNKNDKKTLSGIYLQNKDLQTYVTKQFEILKKNINNIKIKLPKFSFPKLKLPKFKLPKFKLPKFKLPKFKLPKFKLPKFKLPKFKLPKLFNRDKGKTVDVKLVKKIQKNILNAIKKLEKLSLKQVRAPITRLLLHILKLMKSPVKTVDIQPSKKSKKKKPTKLEVSLAKMIKKVNDFIDNFFNIILSYVDAFLDKVLKSAKKIVNKLMTHILAWLLVNVVLLGVIFAILLKLIAKPLMDILQPIMNFIDSIVGKILDFLAPIRDFLIDVFKKIWDIISPVVKAFFDALKPFAAAVAIGLGLFVQSVLKVLKLLMDGIAAGAFDLGKALVRFATEVVNVLALFMKGLSTQAEAIGIGLGKFVKSVLNVLTLLMEGFGTQAKAIGEAIGKVVLAVVTCVQKLVDFLTNVVGLLNDVVTVIRKPIQFIADFFDGFGTNAKKIGEKVSEIALEVLDVIHGMIKELKPYLIDIINTIRMYVIAPLNGLWRWLNSKLITAKNSFWVPTFKWGEPHSITSIGNIIDAISGMRFLKYYPWLDKEVEFGAAAPSGIPNPDEGKSVSELVSDEMSKMQDKIAAEKEAAEAAELAKKLQQKQIEDLLKNQHKLDDILVVAKDNNTKLVDISSKLGLDVVKLDENALSPESLEDVKNKTTMEDLSEGIGSIVDFLRPFADATRQNFELIIQKLDEKPNLIPIPFTNTDMGNTALMENM